MIRNSTLVYDARESLISEWRPTSPLATTFLVSALTTVLSYQIASAFIDLCVAIKPRAVSSVSNIQTLLIVRRSSPLAVFNNTFPRLPSNPDFDYIPPKSPSLYTFLKLVFLLSIAPLANVASIILTLEQDHIFTAAEANFGGIAFSANPDISFLPTTPFSDDCTSLPLQTFTDEDSLAEFGFCDNKLHFNPPVSPTAAAFILVAQRNTLISIHVFTPLSSASTSRIAMVLARQKHPNGTLSSDPKLYYVRHNFSETQASYLVREGTRLLGDWCGQGAENALSESVPFVPPDDSHQADVVVGNIFSCKGANVTSKSGQWTSIPKRVLSHATFVNSNSFSVISTEEFVRSARRDEDSSDLFQSGDNLLLIRRHRSYASVLVLLALVAAAVGVRMTIKCLTFNDIERGVGMFVRSALGIPCLDTMLAYSNVLVQFGSDGISVSS